MKFEIKSWLRWAVLLLIPWMILTADQAAAEMFPRRMTVLIYMCGSNLESEYGSATVDLDEMTSAGINTDEISVLVMTGGSRSWMQPGFDPDATGILEITRRSKRLIRGTEASRNMGSASSLTEFLQFGVENYPAEEYALILWDHGAGPVNGICWDERFGGDHLTLEELTSALEGSPFSTGKLAWIGFDACLMSSVEVAFRLSPYAEYMIASQAEEPARGWNYSFLKGLERDANGEETARRIIDAYFDTEYRTNVDLTLSCVDLSRVGEIESSMDQMYQKISVGLNQQTFSRYSRMRFSATGFGKGAGGSGYDLVDLVALSESYAEVDPEGAERIRKAVEAAVVVNRSNVEGSFGLSVYHPYRNQEKYLSQWQRAYQELNFCPGYTRYVDAYGSIMTGKHLVSWSGLDRIEASEEDVVSLELTEDQLANMASARLIVVAKNVYDAEDEAYFRVFSSENVLAEEGRLISRYDHTVLSVVNSSGYGTLTGAISYRVTEDGVYQVNMLPFRAADDRKAASKAGVIGISRMDEQPVIAEYIRDEYGQLKLKDYAVYDEMTGSYSRRAQVDWTQYDGVTFLNDFRLPTEDEEGVLRSFDTWRKDIHRDAQWRTRQDINRTDFILSFAMAPSHGEELYAMYEITDTQGNVYTSAMKYLSGSEIRYNIPDIHLSGNALDVNLLSGRLRDNPQEGWLRFALSVFNMTDQEQMYVMDDVRVNGIPVREKIGLLQDGDGEMVRLGKQCLSPLTWGTVMLYLDTADLEGFSADDSIRQITGIIHALPGDKEGITDSSKTGFAIETDFPLTILSEDAAAREGIMVELDEVIAPAILDQELMMECYTVIRPATDVENVRILLMMRVENTTDADLTMGVRDVSLNGISMDNLKTSSYRGGGQLSSNDREGIAPGETGTIALEIKYSDLVQLMPDVELSEIACRLSISKLEGGESLTLCDLPLILDSQIPLNLIYGETDLLPSRQLVNMGRENRIMENDSEKLLLSWEGCELYLNSFYIIDGKTVLLLRAENTSEVGRRLALGNGKLNDQPAEIGKTLTSAIEVHNNNTKVFGLERQDWPERTGANWTLSPGEEKWLYMEVRSEDEGMDSFSSVSFQAYLREAGNPMSRACFDFIRIETKENIPVVKGSETIVTMDEFQIQEGRLLPVDKDAHILEPEVIVSDALGDDEIRLEYTFPQDAPATAGFFALLRNIHSARDLAAQNIINETDRTTNQTLVILDEDQSWLLWEMQGLMDISPDGRSGSVAFPAMRLVIKEGDESIPLTVTKLDHQEDKVLLNQVGQSLYFESAEFPDVVLDLGIGSIEVLYHPKEGKAELNGFKQVPSEVYTSLADIVTQSAFLLPVSATEDQIIHFFMDDSGQESWALSQYQYRAGSAIQLALEPIDPGEYSVVYVWRAEDGELHCSEIIPLGK